MAEEKTSEEYINIYEPVMDSIVSAMCYRILGMASFHGDPEEVKNFIRAEVDIGKYGGTFEENKWPFWFNPIKPIAGIVIDGSYWENVNVSKPGTPEEDRLTVNIWVWSIKEMVEDAPLFRGDNTMFMRENWWGLYLLRARFETMLGLPRHSLAFFR